FLLVLSLAEAQNRISPFTSNDLLQASYKSTSELPRQYLSVNPEVMSSSNVAVGDIFIFEHDSVEYDFTVKKVVSYRPGTYTYVANTGLNYFYFTVGANAAIGAIHIPYIQFEAAVINNSVLEASYLQEHDHSDELGCGIHLIQ